MEGGAFSYDGGVSQTKHVKLGAGDESRKITKVILGHGILSVNTEKKAGSYMLAFGADRIASDKGLYKDSNGNTDIIVFC